MNSVTNNNIWFKCYITFCNIVANEKRSSQYLAIAINKFKEFFIYSNFFSFTEVPFSSMVTIHSTESPGFTSKNFLTCCGIIKRAESNWLLPFPTFDLNLNIGMFSFLYFNTNIYVITSIYNNVINSVKNNVKIYILGKSNM